VNSNGAPELAVLFRDSGRDIDAIRDYTHLLADGLRDEGASAGVSLLQNSFVPDPPPGTNALLVNYNPFSWGRWGWAPELPGSLARLRTAPRRPAVTLIVHEPYVPWGGFKQTLMAAWQRTQIAALLRLADLALVSIEPWVPEIQRLAGSGTPVHHLPVGSNLPDMRHARQERRARLGIRNDNLVLAFFGGRHPSRLVDHLREAIVATSQLGRRVVVINLGADPPSFRGLSGRAELFTPGPLGPSELARLLSVADLFAAPYIDGASSRRGTIAAALQHGLPTVSTSGALTDPFLIRSGALVLVPPGSPADFGEKVADLANDSEARMAIGLRARQLFEERFDWRAIARRVLALLPARFDREGNR
jgi:glycosyltransferase involved in cell wall biosynthesis